MVKCWYDQTGLIEMDGMGRVWCEWDVKDITEYDKFNTYYRKKHPDYWAVLPSWNHQACTHHESLFNSWVNAKVQTVPEGFVLVPQEPTEVMLKAGYDNKNFMAKSYKAMIGAWEQSHD